MLLGHAAPAARVEAPPARSPWIVSPGFDGFWMLAGVWLLLGFGASKLLGFDDLVTGTVAATATTLALLHAWSTTWTVLGSPLFAEARAARPTELYAVPALIMASSLLLGVVVITGPGFEPGAGFGWQHGAYALYVMSFVVFHFFHFGQQDFGVLSLYRFRAGQTDPLDRKVDLFLARFVAMGCMPILNLELFARSPFRAWVFSWLPITPGVLTALAQVAIVAALAVTGAALAFELRKPTMSVPKVFYIVIIGLHALTLYVSNFTGFALVYVYSHWLIAIALSWRINRNHNVASPDPSRAWLTYALGFGACIAVSAGIHLGLEEFDLFGGADFREHVGQAGVLLGLVAGFALGEQLTHYYYDRVLFRFADPYVRQRVGPLLR